MIPQEAKVLIKRESFELGEFGRHLVEEIPVSLCCEIRAMFVHKLL